MRSYASLVLIAALLPVPVFGQASDTSTLPSSAPQFQQHKAEQEPLDKDIEKRMEKARLEERYRNLKRDSQKLLELATELKQYVDKANENVLSMEVVNKCDEIEKLAKKVRGRMKGD